MHRTPAIETTLSEPPMLGELVTTDPANDKAGWTDAEWSNYINAPEANPVLAIIERGKRALARIIHDGFRSDTLLDCRSS